MQSNDVGEKEAGNSGASVVLEHVMKWAILVIRSTNTRTEFLPFETGRSEVKWQERPFQGDLIVIVFSSSWLLYRDPSCFTALVIRCYRSFLSALVGTLSRSLGLVRRLSWPAVLSLYACRFPPWATHIMHDAFIRRIFRRSLPPSYRCIRTLHSFPPFNIAASRCTFDYSYRCMPRSLPTCFHVRCRQIVSEFITEFPRHPMLSRSYHYRCFRSYSRSSVSLYRSIYSSKSSLRTRCARHLVICELWLYVD
jgi:hypothetical protein